MAATSAAFFRSAGGIPGYISKSTCPAAKMASGSKASSPDSRIADAALCATRTSLAAHEAPGLSPRVVGWASARQHTIVLRKHNFVHHGYVLLRTLCNDVALILRRGDPTHVYTTWGCPDFGASVGAFVGVVGDSMGMHTPASSISPG
jgi:hypothetical protein